LAAVFLALAGLADFEAEVAFGLFRDGWALLSVSGFSTGAKSLVRPFERRRRADLERPVLVVSLSLTGDVTVASEASEVVAESFSVAEAGWTFSAFSTTGVSGLVSGTDFFDIFCRPLDLRRALLGRGLAGVLSRFAAVLMLLVGLVSATGGSFVA
jgi:hypothetical protein